MHFPIKLENRPKFINRYSKILEAIEKMKLDFQPFFSIVADETVVDWPEKRTPKLKNFPYHYNNATYEYLANQIKALRLDNF